MRLEHAAIVARSSLRVPIASALGILVLIKWMGQSAHSRFKGFARTRASYPNPKSPDSGNHVEPALVHGNWLSALPWVSV